jgi:hypothetical protein
MGYYQSDGGSENFSLIATFSRYVAILSNRGDCSLSENCQEIFRPLVTFLKAIISFMSVCVSVRIDKLISHWREFHEI